MVGGRNKRREGATGRNDIRRCSNSALFIFSETGCVELEKAYVLNRGDCWPRNRPPSNTIPTVMIYNVSISAKIPLVF